MIVLLFFLRKKEQLVLDHFPYACGAAGKPESILKGGCVTGVCQLSCRSCGMHGTIKTLDIGFERAVRLKMKNLLAKPGTDRRYSYEGHVQRPILRAIASLCCRYGCALVATYAGSVPAKNPAPLSGRSLPRFCETDREHDISYGIDRDQLGQWLDRNYHYNYTSPNIVRKNSTGGT